MAQADVLKVRREARDLARQGRLADAIAALKQLISATQAEPHRDDYLLLGLYHFNAGQPLAAARVLEVCHRLWPSDGDVLKNIGVCYSRAGAASEAKPWLLRAVEAFPDDANLHDALTDVYFQLGDAARARQYGERALVLKDDATLRLSLDAVRALPPFDETRPERNVLSFSLWGRADRYVEGALQNARLAPHLYAGWRCRFYVDALVSDRVTSELLALGADVVRMPKQTTAYEGLFWRFLPAFDQDVDRFLVRDADAVISMRERIAVDRWLESDRHFHVMRDHPKHTDLMLAGLWGGVGGVLPDLRAKFAGYLTAANKTANCDQKFLRDEVWPRIRSRVLIHDSQRSVLGAQPFPETPSLGVGRHVGQDGSVLPRPGIGRVFAPEVGPEFQARQHFVFSISSGRSGTAYLTNLLKAASPEAECHHERTGYDRMGVHSPDASTFMLFNSQGNVADVRAFWRRKFSLIGSGHGASYVEASHFLCKAGLVENLDLLGSDVSVDLIDLRRDVFAVAWSFANRFDYANSGFTWLFALDPGYPRRIIDPRPFQKHRMFGACLWYVLEMHARADYYKLLLLETSSVRVHTVSLDELTVLPAAQVFLGSLALPASATNLKALPERANELSSRPLGEAAKERMQKLVDAVDIDPAVLAERYFASGQRLGAVSA